MVNVNMKKLEGKVTLRTVIQNGETYNQALLLFDGQGKDGYVGGISVMHKESSGVDVLRKLVDIFMEYIEQGRIEPNFIKQIK